MQFLGRVAEDAEVGKAVVNAAAVHVDDGDHVGGVVADQVEELFALEKLSADAMDQKILVDGVKIEEENQANEAAHGLREDILGVVVLMNVCIREKKGRESDGEEKSDDGRSRPEPPFPALDASEVGAGIFDLGEAWILRKLWLRPSQKSPSGHLFFPSLRGSHVLEPACGDLTGPLSPST